MLNFAKDKSSKNLFNILQKTMALTAKLQFGNNDIGRYDREYMVVDVRCHFARKHNQVAPTTQPKCESIELIVIAPDKTDLRLYEWYMDMESQSGRLLFDNTSVLSNSDGDDKVILFNDAQCFAITEFYDATDKRCRLLKLELDASELIVDNISFDHI